LKINVFLNNKFVKYKTPLNITESLDYKKFLDITAFARDGKHLIILRGEPVLYPRFEDALTELKDVNHMLTTEGYNIERLLAFPRTIPYLSFLYDGFKNDEIKQAPLAANVFRAIEALSNKQSIFRFNYTISPYNLDWLVVDAQIMRQYITKYKNMARPFFNIYQQGMFYGEANFSWTPLTKVLIDFLNQTMVLTENELKSMNAWLAKQPYECISPQNNMTVLPDGTVKLCMSHRMNETIGDLNKVSFSEVVAMSEEIRKSTASCPFRFSCWMSYHFKDNVGLKDVS
jgi:MoaA/NifB/PqqE/SkfB family radical SAM enzyme